MNMISLEYEDLPPPTLLSSLHPFITFHPPPTPVVPQATIILCWALLCARYQIGETNMNLTPLCPQ